MLVVENLNAKYHKTKRFALNSISFSAKPGEFILVAGPSGSGKSTLAKILLGLIPSFEKATISGSITFNDVSISALSRKDLIEQLGYVPQYPSDFTTSLLVEEEIVFSLENLALPRNKINKLLDETFEKLNIGHLRNRLITELSSGELQKVSLASALAASPSILILDEPIARIDPKTEIELVNLLKTIAENGHIVLAFEHRLDYILSKADRLIILDKGKLIADGDPKKHLHLLEKIDPPEISLLEFPSNDVPYLSLEDTIDIQSKQLKSTFISKNESETLFEEEELFDKDVLKCENLSFKYNKKSSLILEDISLTLQRGQIIGLTGINGSGKSTLFKIISGILKPDKGKISILDKKIKSVRSASKSIILIPENAKLFLIGPTPRKDLERELKDSERTQAIFEEMQLTDLIDKKLYHLSEGERRLIALVNSFQFESDIILLDEPTIALDKNGRNILLKLLNKAKTEGKMVIIASNDPRIFPHLDRMIVLRDNHIFMEDTPRKVLYSLENQTDLIPNQTVRFIQALEKQYQHKLPHFLTPSELNEYLRREL
ncbi:MAG: ATP-binding cassette domain-containing protein [Candidatus Heimdallarchaeota archaeon]|nr:ATP-binding cassette domain-containing protein [Candidatus Heimdallarchaeota archaeon]